VVDGSHQLSFNIRFPIATGSRGVIITLVTGRVYGNSSTFTTMPPRRSSRSTRASVEPTPDPVPAKRKRGTADEPEDVVAKPPSRTRRSTSAQPRVPSTSGRTSTRCQGSLPDVQENDGQEEGSDAPPPVKKSRPSVEPQEDEEESEFEEEKPKTRRASSMSKKPSSSRKAVPSSTRARRPSRLTTPIHDVEDQEEDEDVPAAPKPIRRNGTAGPPVKEEDASVHVPEEGPPPSNGRKPRSVRKPSKKASTSRADTTGQDEEDETKPEPETPINATQPPEEEAGEEEQSLFEPPPMPAPSSLPKTMPEEPSGPKARLVIHKMALINFKSYAGRQEIGPFHKVSHSLITVSSLDHTHHSSSHFLPSSDPTDQASPTQSTPCYSSLVIVPRKCARENSLNSSTTLPDTQTSANVV